jgi:hypothetical protein
MISNHSSVTPITGIRRIALKQALARHVLVGLFRASYW